MSAGLVKAKDSPARARYIQKIVGVHGVKDRLPAGERGAVGRRLPITWESPLTDERAVHPGIASFIPDHALPCIRSAGFAISPVAGRGAGVVRAGFNGEVDVLYVKDGR